MTTLATFEAASPFVHNANCVENLFFRLPHEGRGPSSAFTRPSGLDSQTWEALIDSIGSKSFFSQLSACLDFACHVDHTSLFQLHDSSLSVIAAESRDGGTLAAERVDRYTTTGLWRFDPSIHHIRRSLKARDQQSIRVNLDGLSHVFRERLYEGLSEKIVLSGIRKSSSFVLNLIRDESKSRFNREEIEGLLQLNGPLISVVAKHLEATRFRADRALQASVPEIQACLEAEQRLTSRELQVCARTIYGMCLSGIAVDLKVGEETIKTYRNRAYQKLGIGSQRELLMWYLSLWNPFDH